MFSMLDRKTGTILTENSGLLMVPSSCSLDPWQQLINEQILFNSQKFASLQLHPVRGKGTPIGFSFRPFFFRSPADRCS